MEVEIHFPNITNTLQLTGCLFGEKPSGWTYPMHHHHLFELLYCRAGEVTLQIKQQTVRFLAGEWLLVRPGVRHDFHNGSERSYSFFNVHFDMDDKDVRRLLGTDSFVHIPSEMAAKSRLPFYMEEIERLMQVGNPNEWRREGIHTVNLPYEDKMAMQAYILLLINQLIGLRSSLLPNTSVETVRLAGDMSFYEADVAHKIEDLLNRDAQKGEVSVMDVAKRLGLSRSQCSKVFTKAYGISPRQYISNLKLKEAKQQLLHTNKTVESIASQLGFGSASHFSRQFRRWTGVSPNQYRPKHILTPEGRPQHEDK